MARVVAVTFVVTLGASLAARLGPIPMAAFQTCLQVWLTSSLLADGLAVAVQVIYFCLELITNVIYLKYVEDNYIMFGKFGFFFFSCFMKIHMVY